MNRPKPRVKPAKPDQRIIEVKALIKDQIKVLNILKAHRKEIETDIFLAKTYLDGIIADKLWNHSKRVGKRLAALQKKEADVVEAIASVNATIDRLGNKCRDLRALCNDLKRHQASLAKVKSAPASENCGVHSNAGVIKIYEELVQSAIHKLRAFKI